MHRSAKIKVVATRLPLRKAATTAAPARRAWPAWIDAAERGVTFSAATTVMPRVRAGLVLRVVSRGKRATATRSRHGASAR